MQRPAGPTCLTTERTKVASDPGHVSSCALFVGCCAEFIDPHCSWTKNGWPCGVHRGSTSALDHHDRIGGADAFAANNIASSSGFGIQLVIPSGNKHLGQVLFPCRHGPVQHASVWLLVRMRAIGMPVDDEASQVTIASELARRAN